MGVHLADLLSRHPTLEPLRGKLESAADLLETAFRAGGKVLACGNGGSAADADHLVGELMKGFLRGRPLQGQFAERLPDLASRLQTPLPALSLGGQTALITAIANDLGADLLFAQQVLGYGKPGDILVAFSTSGTSVNVINAAKVARALDMRVVGLTGRSGGDLAGLCDVALCVPADSTPLVQELQLPIYHYLAVELETRFFAV